MPENLTLTGIFNAKGNEASIVYVIGFEQVGRNPNLLVQERNQAFTAMTRTRGWCVLTGTGEKVIPLFKEIDAILSNPNAITFTVPNPQNIMRNLDNLEYERRRNKIKKANELAAQLARMLADINERGVRKQIMDKLGDRD